MTDRPYSVADLAQRWGCAETLVLGHRDSKTSERIYAKTSPEFAADAQNVVRLTKLPKSGGGR
jgi:hypothetical protein